jgi:hypothetical protein
MTEVKQGLATNKEGFVGTLYKSFLLFAMNWLDAQLTIIWVRLNIATEGNVLMAHLLNQGEAPFMLVKLGVGAFAAYVLYRWSHHPLARRGMKVALGVYLLTMVIHMVTGFSALGWHAPEAMLAHLLNLPWTLLSAFS